MAHPFARALAELIAVSVASTLVAGCQATPGGPAAAVPSAATAPQGMRPNAYPPVCTVRKVKSGADATSVTAFGSIINNGTFVLKQPSSWAEVEWLRFPPPGKAATQAPHQDAHAHSSGTYYIYYGTYTVSDGTQGCLYVVTDYGMPTTTPPTAALTAQPRIPPTGATLPVDFGVVATLHLKLRADGTGAGVMQLAHSDGSIVLRGRLDIVGRIVKTSQ